MKETKNRASRDIIVVGFALFSMFFGAGNVIFPPYLGMESGPAWLAGFQRVLHRGHRSCACRHVCAAARRQQ